MNKKQAETSMTNAITVALRAEGDALVSALRSRDPEAASKLSDADIERILMDVAAQEISQAGDGAVGPGYLNLFGGTYGR